ncbi:MAG: bifunctional pyr operon transcriptional regulator/uracil phosphoribosyltransferase PyrR [Ruaniaceae bacterium]|nr:bifunctional pyr operon transcriptional regulator/uracil phosphoribosyltransferase PyrR [Ruaniaceae bacterium]
MSRNIMDAGDIARSLTRISHEILEKNHGASGLMILGILRRGAPLAQRIAANIAASGEEVAVGSLDITPYRDDLRTSPTRAMELSELPLDGVDGKVVVLIDDVLYSGRTVRAALDAVLDIGRPERIQLAVLVDRGHRELPIRPDFVGKNIPTSHEERVTVSLEEIDGYDAVIIEEGR